MENFKVDLFQNNKIKNIEESLFKEFMLLDDFSILDNDLQKQNSKIDNLISESLKIPAFSNFIKNCFPDEKLVANIPQKTKKLIDEGVLKFVQKNDGSFSAILKNGNNKFAEHITLRKELFSPDLLNSINNMAMQAQLADIMERLQEIKVSVDNIYQGQRDDRYALCESAIQQMLSANKIEDKNFRQICIGGAIKSISDGKMQIFYSIKRNVEFIKNAEVGFFGDNQEEIDKNMLEVHKGLSVFIKSSCIESVLHLSLNENQSSLVPLKNCVKMLNKNFDSETCELLNDNLSKNIVNKKILNIDFWHKKFPETISLLENKVVQIEKNNINLIN